MKKNILFLTLILLLGAFSPGVTFAVPEGIEVDVEGKKVIVSGFLNTRYYRKPSPYAVVFREGFSAKRSLFIAHADPFELIDGLVEIGAIPAFQEGKEETEEGEQIPEEPFKESQLFVSVSWEGVQDPYPLRDIVRNSISEPYEFRFQGNSEIAKKMPSGDLLCLDFCEIGVASNTLIEGRRYEEGEVFFVVNKKLLPANGTGVKIILSLEDPTKKGEEGQKATGLKNRGQSQ